MSQYRFELAGPQDDADLRHILAMTPMEGSMVVGFRREPSYFDAAVVEGRVRQVVAARHVESGRIVGFGARSITERYVHGTPTPVGYLSSLRLLEGHRNFGLVVRGFRYFRELHNDGLAPFYLTTIAAKNQHALELLTSGRAGLPRYQAAGDFHTFALSMKSRQTESSSGLELRTAEPADIETLIAFLNSEGQRRQFFPCYSKSDLLGESGLLRGLSLENLLLAFRKHQLVGVAGLWNQREFRQTVVERYRGMLRWLRPPYNALAPIARWPQLADPGEQIRDVFLAFPVVAGDDPQVFAALLMVTAHRSNKQADYLLVGMHSRDPLLKVVRAFRGICYTTRLFYVTWDDGCGLPDALDGRPIYLELGAL